MKIDVISSVPEAKSVFSDLLKNPEKAFEMIRFDLKQIAERTMSDLLKVEMSQFLGRESYERQKGVVVKEKNYRNGSYNRKFAAKSIGELNLTIPRDRNGEFNSKIISKYDRYDRAIEKDISPEAIS